MKILQTYDYYFAIAVGGPTPFEGERRGSVACCQGLMAFEGERRGSVACYQGTDPLR
jgi:hypothetical protein